MDILGNLVGGLINFILGLFVDSVVTDATLSWRQRRLVKKLRKGHSVVVGGSLTGWTDPWAELIELEGARVWTVNRYRLGDPRAEVPVASAASIELVRHEFGRGVRVVWSNASVEFTSQDLSVILEAAKTWGPPLVEVDE
ncbi:hypothetical protein Back2_05820 [Nocardioides baekrokdamisoli]|uniref:Uncharacterized protein n=1 Tax=Nocardioides baekrokdamisoli TaxID=1804624 RepID=A0A3G9IJQ5_9ACTN|nr:hypothetical protein [Nocardioides baekrokdamisoli]BBH16295.1 hypothetical protein Back2_05820 [Nocardioides baekrokdamisoli]